MFLLCFLVFTLIFTLFKNVLLASISLLFVGIFWGICQWISKKKLLNRQNIAMLILAFVLAGGSFAVKERRYYGANFPNKMLSMAWSGNNKTTKVITKTIVWTGVIADISNQGKYVFAYNNEEYLLYSKKEYHIGDQLWLVANLQKNNYSSDFSYRRVSSSTFALPIFSGSFDFATWMKMKGRKGSLYETNALVLGKLLPLTPSETPQQVRGRRRRENLLALTPARGAGQTPEEGNIDRGVIGSGISEVDSRFRGNDLKNNDGLSFIQQMKKGIQEKIIKIYGKGRVSGLLLGMLIGDRSQISVSEYQNFIDSGLVHLVAVSGGNILMIVVFLQCILFFLPFYVRTGLILLTIILYSLICGLDSSVFRAVIMGSLNMIALFRGREIQIWRLLSISVIVMLSVNPYFLAYDTGFLLSYSALIGIIYFTSEKLLPQPLLPLTPSETKGEVKEKSLFLKALHYVYTSYISPSIGASIGIFPIIIFFMGKINVLGIVGNLFVLPIVPFVMIYGFISLWLYSWLGWAWLLWFETIFIDYIYIISELLSTYGLYIMVTGLWLKYIFLLAGVGLFVWWRVTPPPSAPPLK